MSRFLLFCIVAIFAIAYPKKAYAYIFNGGQHFVTESFAAPVLDNSRLGDIDPGHLFLCPEYTGIADGPLIMTSSGELVWRTEHIWEASNMDTQTLHEEQVLTYWTGFRDTVIGLGYGGVHILNASYQEIYYICGDKLKVSPLYAHPNTTCQLDPHESRITPRGSLLATVRTVRKANLTSVGGPEHGWVLDSEFYELDIPTEKVLFRWSAFEHRHSLPLTMSKSPLKEPDRATPILGRTKDKAWDFFHMNSVDMIVTHDGRIDGYLVSSRYLWSVIKVATSGEVEWVLQGQDGGDFALSDTSNFRWQHAALAGNVTATTMDIRMMDNANLGGGTRFGTLRPSSGLLLQVDYANMRATTITRLSPPTTVHSLRLGNYQALQYHNLNHALVDFGYPAKVYEFNNSGNVVWQATIHGPNTALYRVYKKAWIGRPRTKPKAIAQHHGSKTQVWLSWLGDTEVRIWQIHGRKTAEGRMQFVANVAKSGFETYIVLNETLHELQATGKNANVVIGKSAAVKVKAAGSVKTLTQTSSATFIHVRSTRSYGIGAMRFDATKVAYVAIAIGIAISLLA